MSLRSIALSPITPYIKNDFQTIDASETISSLLDVFTKTKHYELLVRNRDRIEVVTVRDILKVHHPDRTSVVKISKSLPSILSSASIAEAVDRIVKNNIRTLRVFDRDVFLGLVLQTDLLNELVNAEELKEFPAEEVMVERLITATKNSSAASVRSLMLRNNISHVPLISKLGDLKGIVTAKDLVWYYIHPRESLNRGDRRGEKIGKWSSKVSGIEDKNPVSATPRTSLLSVVQRMKNREKSCCVIIKKKKLTGIITPREILALLREFKPKKEIPMYVLGIKNSDPIVVEEARNKILRVIKRGMKIHPDIQESVIRVRVISKAGGKSFFKLNGRIYLPRKVLTTSSQAWSLRAAFDQLYDKLDRKLRT